MYKIRLMLIVGSIFFFSTFPVNSGNLDSPAPPEGPAGAMYNLEDIYQRLNTGAAGTLPSSGAPSPSAGPAPTGHTLNDIMNKAPLMDNANGATPADVAAGKTFWGLTGTQWGLQTGTADGSSSPSCPYPSPTARTGQFTKYADGDDGDLQKGATTESYRFEYNDDGTVTDTLTGLVWLMNANPQNEATIWTDALAFCNNLAHGMAGLTDNSVAGDWRMPNIKELFSLVNHGAPPPVINPNPFGTSLKHNVSDYYWSSTTLQISNIYKWRITFDSGIVYYDHLENKKNFVLPVRDPK